MAKTKLNILCYNRKFVEMTTVAATQLDQALLQFEDKVKLRNKGATVHFLKWNSADNDMVENYFIHQDSQLEVRPDIW